MKKTFTLLMALALVTSLFAVPQNPKLQAKEKKTQPQEQVERVSFTRHTDLALMHAAELNIARPVAHMAKKNISRNAVRRAPMATAPVTFSGSDFTGGTSGEGSAMTISKGGVTITTDKGYGSGSQLRVYSGGALTITATEKMTNIAFENDGNAKLMLQDQTPNATTWTVSATAQIRLNEIVVSFEGSAPDPLDTLTVAEALAEAKKLAGGASSSKKYVIEGYVSSVLYEYSQGKETFYMTDTKGDKSGELQAFKCSLEEAAYVDNKVSVVGKLMNYVKNQVSTYEITGGVGTILEGGAPKGDTIYLNTMAYAEAYLSGGYWDFDMYVDYDEEAGVTYPEFYFMCDEDATSETAISGEWSMYYAGLWNSENDSIEMADGGMTVTVNADKTYNFYGEFTDEDGNLYVVDMKNIAVSAYDVDNDYAEIELDEDGGVTPPTGVDTVVVPVNYVQAVRMDEYSSAGAYLWEFDAMNYTSNTQYENMWFYIYTKQDDRLEGIYDIESDNIYNFYGYYYYAGYTKVNGNDTTDVAAGTENIQLMVAYDETSKAYDLVGELLDEEGTTLYQFAVEDIDIVAFNEEEKDIVLMDSVAFVPDTIDITGQDAIEFAYYASYSEVGAYNYSVNLYSVANDYPYLMLDVYATAKDDLVGSYDTTTNVGEYCAFYSSDETEIGVVNPVFTITKSGDVYTVAGSFEGADMNFYRFSVSAIPTMADGDYPYEPMDKQADVNIVANSKDLVTDYVSDYNELDIYLNGATDTIQLALTTSKTTIADGTYTISNEEETATGELIGGYYTYYGMGGCVAYVGNDVYYLTAGSLVVSTANDTTTYTLNATSVHGTVITATYKEVNAGPTPPTPGEHTIIIEQYQDTSFVTTDKIYTVKAHKAGGTQAPAYNDNGKDLRVYANGTLEISATVEMTQMVFNISTAGLKRQATITPSTGAMTYDMNNAMVTWTGKASEVSFTVGAKAEYGTESTKAGQFDFTSIDITLSDPAGLNAVMNNESVSKFIMNGKLFIQKNGVIYNAQGQIVK